MFHSKLGSNEDHIDALYSLERLCIRVPRNTGLQESFYVKGGQVNENN